MTLIIRDALVNPPTWFASFRDLTLYCAVMLKLDIVIESEEVDIYHRWLRRRGGMDFVRDFVRPGQRSGAPSRHGARLSPYDRDGSDRPGKYPRVDRPNPSDIRQPRPMAEP